jgi:hypothetical protein
VPPWLVLLVTGIAIGAGAVVLVQERYLPPRLSADATAKLRAAYEQANTQREQLAGELAKNQQQLQAALADKKGLTEALSTSRATTDRLRDDVSSLVSSLPPDPRGGVIEVRAGKFTAKDGMLAFEIACTRERAAGKPIPAVMQLVVAGESAKGTASTATLAPVAFSIGSHELVRGNAALPDGFRPRQATVQVLDRVGGKLLGMRVMLVNK